MGDVASSTMLSMPSLHAGFQRLVRRQKRVRLLLWETGDERVVEAAQYLRTLGCITPVFLTDSSPPWGVEALPARAIREQWRSRSTDRSDRAPRSDCEIAAAAIAMGLVDAVVGGVATSSADVLRAGLQFVGLAAHTKTISISGLVEPVVGPLAGHLLLMTDTGAVVDPTEAQLVDIARNGLRTWRTVSTERPRIAFLSASTKGSASAISNIGRIRRAVDIIRSDNEVDVDGELQFDAATVPRVARAKIVAGPVAGRANILVFPGIDSCNIGYKIAEHIGGARTAPVTQGFACSYHDVSRGAEVPDLIGTCVVAAMMGAEHIAGQGC